MVLIHRGEVRSYMSAGRRPIRSDKTPHIKLPHKPPVLNADPV
jgi:hypothetical protein